MSPFLSNFSDSSAIIPDGILITVISVAFYRQKKSLFARHFSLACNLTGQGFILFGFYLQFNSLAIVALLAISLAVLMFFIVPDPIQQFVGAGTASVLAIFAISVNEIPGGIDVVSCVTLPLGLYLLLVPTRPLDSRPTAYALLLVPPILYVLTQGGISADELMGRWLGRGVQTLGFVWLFLIISKRQEESWKPVIFISAFVTFIICLLAPIGNLSFLLLLLLAFSIESWSLAVVASVTQILLVVKLYYDLDIDLLHKSILMVAVGFLLLIPWFMIKKRVGS
ncbi:MAG: DUF4401 domain-containing protein [Magnetococcales bacterium]|nr:DUF4401 domain-containing protein [Magnetococcales bacterium]